MGSWNKERGYRKGREMKTIELVYSVGFGSHETTFEVEDTATEEEIEEIAKEIAFNAFEWGYKVLDEEGINNE